MTPEEWVESISGPGKALYAEIDDEDLAEVVVMLKEALKAERERCASMCDDFAKLWTMKQKWLAAPREQSDPSDEPSLFVLPEPGPETDTAIHTLESSISAARQIAAEIRSK